MASSAAPYDSLTPDVVLDAVEEAGFATDGRLLVNELAMRPHNSAHWTIEGARTSQFEQHLRAVLDLPLGATTPTAPVSVMTNVLGGPDDAGPLSCSSTSCSRRRGTSCTCSA